MKYALEEALRFLGMCVIVGFGVGITGCIAIGIISSFLRIVRSFA